MSDLDQAWQTSCAVTDHLLAAIPDEGLEARYSKRTRTVASQFAHLHNVRVSHLERRGGAKKGALETFPRGAQPTRKELETALARSAKAVGEMLADYEEQGAVRSWKGPPASYLGYFVAHEAHHRGLVLVSLRFAGIKLDKSVGYGIWDMWRKGV